MNFLRQLFYAGAHSPHSMGGRMPTPPESVEATDDPALGKERDAHRHKSMSSTLHGIADLPKHRVSKSKRRSGASRKKDRRKDRSRGRSPITNVSLESVDVPPSKYEIPGMKTHKRQKVVKRYAEQQIKIQGTFIQETCKCGHTGGGTEKEEEDGAQPSRLYALPWHLWGTECSEELCKDPNFRECPQDCPHWGELDHESSHYIPRSKRVELAPGQHLCTPFDWEGSFDAREFDFVAWDMDQYAQIYIMFDIGPQKSQLSMHEAFLNINPIATPVFKKIFQYAELVEVKHTYSKAYRLPESLGTFKLFLEYLVRDVPQRPGGPPLFVLDEASAEELLDFARKWDIEELQEELRDFLKPIYERKYGFGPRPHTTPLTRSMKQQICAQDYDGE